MTTVFSIASVAAVSTAATELPPVTVEASRLNSRQLEMAANVEVVDSGEIAHSYAKDVPDLLTRSPGVQVSGLGAENPAVRQISMRGYGENGYGRVLVMVDGERINNPDMTAPNLARIPLSGIAQMEILHGPQTVLYGDAASAGMVNVVTDKHSGEGMKGYAEISGGSYGSAGAAFGVRGKSSEEGIGYFGDFGYGRSDGFRENSSFDIWNAQGGVRRDFDNGAFLKFSAFFSAADYDLPGPLSEADARRRPKKSTYDDHARLASSGFNFTGRGLFAEDHELDFTFTFSARDSHYRNGDYTDIYGVRNLYSRDYQSDIYAIRFSPQYTCLADIAGFENKFTAGIETRWETVSGEALENYPAYAFSSRERCDIDRLVSGIFAFEEFFVTEKISVAGGARLERVWNGNDISADGGRTDNLLALESALVYRPVETAKVFLRWTKFYRNPFIDEYRWRNFSRTGTAEPERGINVELGGLWEIDDEWYAKATAFCSETSDEIMYDPYLMSNENSDDLHRRAGMECAIGWEREKTAGFKAAWSGVAAEVAEGEYDGAWVPGVPRQQLDLEGRVWLFDELSVTAGGRMIGSRYAISDVGNANGRISAAGIMRVAMDYRPGFRFLEGLIMVFSCDNLFDKEYCDFAVASVVSGANAWYPAVGRTFNFTVRYEF